jgi:Patched family
MLVRSLEEIDEAAFHAGERLDIEERFRRTLSRGGMSISVTSLTSIAAFLIGSIGSIPALLWCELRASVCRSALVSGEVELHLASLCTHPGRTCGIKPLIASLLSTAAASLCELALVFAPSDHACNARINACQRSFARRDQDTSIPLRRDHSLPQRSICWLSISRRESA